MNWFNDLPTIYLHRQPVDFRKAVNGLCEVVETELSMNPFDECLYVFCNRSRDRLKILHWIRLGLYCGTNKYVARDSFRVGTAVLQHMTSAHPNCANMGILCYNNEICLRYDKFVVFSCETLLFHEALRSPGVNKEP